MKHNVTLKTSQKRILLVVLAWLIFSVADAQNGAMADVNESGTDITPDSTLQGVAIEVFKIRNDKTYVFKIGSVLRINCVNRKGRSRMKRAELTRVTEDEFTFTPINRKFDIVTHTPSTLSYIEFVTPGTFSRGVVVNTLIVGSLAAVTTFILLESAVTGLSPRFGGGPGWIQFDDFQRHVHFKKFKKKPQWGVRVVYETFAQN